MANHTKQENDKRNVRSITLSDNEIINIKKMGNSDNLSLAIRNMLKIIQNESESIQMVDDRQLNIKL